MLRNNNMEDITVPAGCGCGNSNFTNEETRPFDRFALCDGRIGSGAPSQPASSHSGWWNGNPSFVVPIREVSVTARRPMKEIGVQQTKLDTTVLHENIALSMADVLTFNTSIFVKQYGRATLSTVAFRGTSPSHTQVTWNGMRINSPMLGMTDFSMIPSYFIDDATLLHGTSSVNMTGGGLGGAVALSTRPAETRGFNMQYVQGIGSFSTFDEFLRLTYGSDRWQTSTRVVYSSSSNDFRYRNYNKKMNIYDDDRNIIGTYYPVERNKCGDFHDLHVLQEAYYNTGRGDRLGLQAWYIHSRRGVPMLNVDYRSDTEYRNEQCEQTFRSILSWDHWRKIIRSGSCWYIHTRQTYDFSQDKGNGDWAEMIRSRSFVNTLYGSVEGEYYIGKKWLFTANVSVHQHFVKSKDRNVLELNSQSIAQGNNKKWSWVMTRGASNCRGMFRPSGCPPTGWACRSRCAKRCSGRSGPRLFQPSSPIIRFPSGATSWPRPPSRATTGSRRSTTSTSCRAATPT